MKVRNLILCTVAAGLLSFAAPAPAAEWEKSTPYYEDDGLLDITEWFDGNDYNPTDEKFGRWDDETYQARQDTGTDRDNDRWYGYEGQRGDNDWFYDYYDTGDYVWLNTGPAFYSSRFYDYDNDGIYDAYISRTDRDGDGIYDRFNYHTFGNPGSDKQQQAARSEQADSSKRQTIQGKIQSTKQVQTRGGKHLVAQVKQDDKTVAVDLGKADDLQAFGLKQGDELTVDGSMFKVGDHQVVVASSIKSGTRTHQINRERKSLSGTITDTRKVKVHGHEHQMAIVNTQRHGKVAVDMGPADKLDMKLNKDQLLSFSGVPVKVKDRQLIVARSYQKDGRTVQVQHGEFSQPMAAGGKSPSTQPAAKGPQSPANQKQQQSSTNNE